MLPDTSKGFPVGKDLRVTFQEEVFARKKAETGKELLDSSVGKALMQAGKEKIESLLKGLSELSAEAESVRLRPMPWIEKAVYDVLTDRDTPWKELLKLSEQYAESLHGLAAQVDSFDVSIPQDMDKKKLLHDAKALKEHFEQGGSAGIWIFKPKTVREHGGLIGKVRVDGLECNGIDTLQKLIDFLTVEQHLNYI